MKITHQKDNANYLMAMSAQPQASWNLMTDNVNPCDNTLFHYHHIVRDPATSAPHLTFKNTAENLLGDLGFSGHEPPHLLTCSCNKTFSASYSDVSVCLVSLCARHMKLH